MLTPVKLIDGENLQWCDNAMEFLVDQTNFYVVGILGLQGSGKSTVMSLLAGQLGEIGGRQLFKPETRELREKGEHCTSGVDIYVTSERMILLDTQPLLSASVMDHMIQFEKKIPCGTDYRATEIALQIQSLQIAAFLLTVCHTVILVQDWFTDPNLLRFIQSAEMLKPATPTNPHDLSASIEDTTDYYPHLVFLQNKCRQGDFSPSTVCEMEELLSNVFQNSKLKSTGSVLMEFIPIRCESLHMDVANLFLLPERETEETGVLPSYRGHPGFNSLGKSLTQQIMSVPRSSLTHTALSEKNWFHYAARMWEAVKKSSLFLEYGRLLP
ncbi:nonsense-mediated mRNA decay factor SMG9 isoform X1 [Tachypleus tridentatus]|uniref:nonsense-mediated mRNA decay factor SMG9 isoform X1 n=1 Tax=Tachypleus tridentatus TaxID=6853 RepID=UPI003FD3356F